tara:strand:+ start:63 stop:332 length:270 start_codon:yes stop_codon:yes gene_type:complete
MGKKEKVIDLKPKVDKISEQHLKELQVVVNNINGIQFNIGKIEAQKHNLLHGLTKTEEQVKIFQEKLVKEYGTYDVNLDDGKINWPNEK